MRYMVHHTSEDPDGHGKIVEAARDAIDKMGDFAVVVQSEVNALRQEITDMHDRMRDIQTHQVDMHGELSKDITNTRKALSEEIDTVRSELDWLHEKVGDKVDSRPPVARDKNGHPLIPGKSVVKYKDKTVNALFVRLTKGNYAIIFRGDSDGGTYGPHFWEVSSLNLSWICDIRDPEAPCSD